jgi:hypothetical protein
MSVSNDIQDLASKEATLHQKYIELLEKRVAQLESVVKQGDEKPKAVDSGGQTVEANKEKEAVRTPLRDWIPDQRELNKLRKRRRRRPKPKTADGIAIS